MSDPILPPNPPKTDPTPPDIKPIPPVPPAVPEPALISIDDFHKVKLVTGEVLSAVAHPKADRLLVLQVKIGDRTKQIVSGIRQYYPPEQLIGKTIVVVDNLQPAKLRGEDSFGMLLAVSLPEGGLRLLTTDGLASSGLKVS